MMNDFKTFLKSEEVKGAFKNHPSDVQPSRIPLDKFQQLSDKVESLLSPHGTVFIPNAIKKALGKKDTGDLDVLFIPKDRNNWRELVLSVIPGIVAKESNGPQLMMVVKGLIDDDQYMIDIILSKEQDWDFRKNYYSFGPIMPAVLGAFARTLGYKFAQSGLYIRLKKSNNNYVNLKLTNDVNTAFRLMGLSIPPKDFLYDPVKISNWIISSSRFDSNRWHNPPSDDGITIVVKNQKAHRAAKKKPETQLAFDILDNAVKRSPLNQNLEIERKVLGDNFVDNLLTQIEDIDKRNTKILDGKEIMSILGIPPGPEVGRWVKYIQDHPSLQGLNPVQAKPLAIDLLKREKSGKWEY
jgi:hypothetical protein